MSSAIIQLILLAILLSVDKVFSSTFISNESTTTKAFSNFRDVTGSTSDVTNDESTPTESQGPVSICPSTSCNGRCGDKPDTFLYKPCACDIHCTMFKDCCVDFHPKCGNSSLGTGLKHRLEECDGSSEYCLSCVDHDRFMFRPLYMVSRCPDHYGNQFVVDQCQDTTSPLVLLHLPAYTNVSGYMYRNVYCAICHDVDVTKIKLYRTEILCPFHETESKVYLENVPLSEQNFTEIYEYRCKIHILKPDDADYPDRSCVSVVLGSCPKPGLLQDYCHQYLEPVRVVFYKEKRLLTARNQYCARCSAYASDEMFCWRNLVTIGGIFTDGLRFSILFDFSSDIQIPEDTQAAPTVTILSQSQYDGASFQNYMFELVIESPRKVDRAEIYQTISRVLDTESVYITECSAIVSTQNNDLRIYNVNGTMPNTELFEERLIEKVDSFVHGTSGASTVLFAYLRNTRFSLDTICMAPTRYYNNDTLSKRLDSVHFVPTKSTANNITTAVHFPLEIIWGKRRNQSLNSSCESIEITMSVQDELSPVFVVCGDVLESHCNLIAYDVDDLLNTTKSQNLSEMEMNFQYVLNSVVAVCEDILLMEDDTPIDLRRTDTEFYITVIGCTLSILGLLVTVGTYCTFTELRNLAGKCILNLVGSMLGAQSLFILGGVVAWRNGVTCHTVAVVQHLLWLATFSWTNILSYDLARTFSGKASVPRARTGQKRFLVYCGIAWIVPTSVVALSAGLNYSHVVNVDYGKNGVCWIRDRLALLATFIAPVSVHIMFNISAFSYTVYHIRKITKLAADMKVTSEKRSQLGVYSRITAIMGFTWIIGYLGNIWPIEALWLIFAALNSLQGFLIFVAFVLTSKVLRLFRKRFLGELFRNGTIRMSSTATRPSNLPHASSTAL